MYKYLFALTLTSTVIISGCGSSSTDSNTDNNSSTESTGVFLDSPIINIGYKTETLEGVTNSLGEYQYLEGEMVIFFIGDLELPSVLAAETITPLNIADTSDTSDSVVVNIIRLLQTLDQDGDPDNGITITETAIASATQVDFTLPASDFSDSSDVGNLISNGGQDTAVTDLVSISDAIEHFENQLGQNEVTYDSLVGTWLATDAEDDFLQLTFFDDGTYMHAEIDLDDTENDSGMEWGTYTRDSETGKLLSTTQYFDENGETGLSDSVSTENVFLSVSGDELTVTVDEDKDGTIDFTLSFAKIESNGVLGTWLAKDDENDLLQLTFFADGTYLHAEVDLDDTDEDSGIEWGTYTQNNETGELTSAFQDFDSNDDTGLSDSLPNGERFFLSVNDDVMTVDIDEDQDDIIDGALTFERIH